MTTAVEARSSLRVGHFTFLSSVLDSRKNWTACSTLLLANRHPSVRLLFRSPFWRARETLSFFISLSGTAVFVSEGDAAEAPMDRALLFSSLSFFHCLFIVPARITVPQVVDAHRIWQARRDSNPHHPDLESGALAVRATGLHAQNLLRLLVERVSSAERDSIS